MGYTAFTRKFGCFSTIVKDNENEMKIDTFILKQILSGIRILSRIFHKIYRKMDILSYST